MTELVIKNKKFIDNSRQMYQKSFWETAKQWPQFEKHFFISGSSGLGKSRFAKASSQEELTSLTARVSIHPILLQRKMERHMISADSEYMAQDDNLYDIDATSFGFQEF